MTKPTPTPNVVDLDFSKAASTEQSVEQMPSVESGISALASAGAPFIYFDTVEFCFTNAGVAGVTLGVHRQVAHGPGSAVRSDKVLVGHLRAPLTAMLGLRDTINTIERLAQAQMAEAAAATNANAPGGRPH